MSKDLSMKKKLKNATELVIDIDELGKGKVEITSLTLKKKTPTRSSDAQGATQLNTGWPPLPLRTIPMCEFCYLSMRPTDQAHYCVEHDMGGHTGCYKLHETTVHQ